MTKLTKSFIMLSSIATITMAQNIELTSDWKLVGAIENINVSNFDNTCVDVVWKYDSGIWSLYKNSSVLTSLPSGINSLQSGTINSGEGFWIKGNSICTVDTNTATEISKPIIPYQVGKWTGDVVVATSSSSNCTWNVTVDIDSSNNAKATGQLLSSSGYGSSECDDFTATQGKISDVTDVSITFNIDSTTSEYIFGGNIFKLKVSDKKIAQESKSFNLQGYPATRITTLKKQ